MIDPFGAVFWHCCRLGIPQSGVSLEREILSHDPSLCGCFRCTDDSSFPLYLSPPLCSHRSLPITQHERIWDLYKRFILLDHVPPQSALRIWKRFLMVCVCVCLLVFVSVSVSVSVSVCLFVSMSVCLFVFVSVCLLVSVSVCLCICQSVCLCLCLCLCICVCACACVQALVYVCVQVILSP